MRVHVMIELRLAALSEAVDVDDRAERIELVELADRRGFPHRSFGGLAVAHQDVGAIVRSDASGIERHANAGGKALPQRAGRDIGKRQPRCRMAFEIGVSSRRVSSSSRGM